MELLNRTALIVTPKRRFLEWVNRLPEAGTPLTIDEAKSSRMVYLLATGDDEPTLGHLIAQCAAPLFGRDNELQHVLRLLEPVGPRRVRRGR